MGRRRPAAAVGYDLPATHRRVRATLADARSCLRGAVSAQLGRVRVRCGRRAARTSLRVVAVFEPVENCEAYCPPDLGEGRILTWRAVCSVSETSSGVGPSATESLDATILVASQTLRVLRRQASGHRSRPGREASPLAHSALMCWLQPEQLPVLRAASWHQHREPGGLCCRYHRALAIRCLAAAVGAGLRLLMPSWPHGIRGALMDHYWHCAYGCIRESGVSARGSSK